MIKNIYSQIERIISQIIVDHGLFSEIMEPSSILGDDLGMDGVDVIEIIHLVEDKFSIQIPDDHITENSSVGNIAELVSDLVREKEERAARAEQIKLAWKGFPET